MLEHGQTVTPVSPPAPKTGPAKFRQWLWDIRTNSRFAYALQVGQRLLTAALNLIWSRLLTEAMGKPLSGLYQAFQSAFSLGGAGGVGDFGIGGAIGIRAGQYLGEGKEKEQELLKFLASGRTLFLLLAILFGGAMVILSPWVPHWSNFPSVTGAGSYTKVFEVGAVMVVGTILFSYISNVNYACGNIAWPVLPDFLLLQFSFAAHLLIARQGQPLWMQFVPYAAATLLRCLFNWSYVRASHPHLSRLLPLELNSRLAASLFESGFWVYLISFGNTIYRNADNLVITAGFEPGTNVDYNYNYRFCDLANFVVITASYVMLPKLTQWMASSDPKDRARVLVEMLRLNQFQILLGCIAALGYLAFNNIFMHIWWYKTNNLVQPAAVTLQIAFALNLAVTSCGDTCLQLSIRSGKSGLRFIGIVTALMGLLNLGLSIVAMKLHLLEGIALATVVAQCGVMLCSSFFICRHLKLAWLPWALKGCILPLAGISFAGWLRMLWPMDSLPHALMLLGSYAALLLAAAWGLGVNMAMIRHELQFAKKLFGK